MREGEFFHQARDRELTGISDEDRRLAHEIAAGVLRNRTLIDECVATHSNRRWDRLDPDVRDLLRVGVYQLHLLDRIPGYAAVSSTVELAKRTVGPKKAAFVNAVLRKIAAGPGPSPESTLNSAAALASRYSHPEWIVTRWIDRHGLDVTLNILELDNTAPELVLQPLRISRDDLMATLEEHGIHFSTRPHERGLRVKGASPQTIPGFGQGWFHIQGPAQARLVEFGAPPDGATVWDACAAPGGKSLPLSFNVRLFASDRSPLRVRILAGNLKRSHADAFTFVADVLATPVRKVFDVVWLDVPCTGTGILGRNPDARWRLSREHLQELTRLQQRILDSCCKHVTSGGLLVYTTCSLEPEENAQQIHSFLERHTEFQRTGEDLEILPVETGADGGYGARLVRG